VKKLERLADLMYVGIDTGAGEKTENEAGDEVVVTTPPTKKAKVAKKRG
jgi:hypothetical protein